MDLINRVLCMKGEFLKAQLMVMVLWVSKMDHSLKVIFQKDSLLMVYLFSTITATMLETSTSFKLLDRAYTKIFKMVTIMKENGKRTCNMGMEYRDIQIKTSILEVFFVEASSGKANTNLQIRKYTLALSIMAIVMDMENWFSQMVIVTKDNGS